MQILVIYSILSKMRLTVYDHLYSLGRYAKAERVFYHNLIGPLPKYLSLVDYDAVILHYSLLSYRCDDELWEEFLPYLEPLKSYPGLKVAIPQDEYQHSKRLCDFFRDFDFKLVFTCAYEEDYRKLYPESSGIEHFQTVLTGYVDEQNLKKIQSFEKIEKSIDIGYRARNLPFWGGSYGLLKKAIEDQFLAQKTSFSMDISTRPEDVFYGDAWLRFLLSCRTSPSCLGGSSLHDPNGSIMQAVNAYVEKNPKASFEEVEKACFPEQDGNLSLFALSPRHFECVMTKTTLLLVEGNYLDIFLPGRNCIEIKKDFSNLPEVLRLVEDRDYCQSLAENAYQDIILSKRYTYASFAQEVFEGIKALVSLRERKGSDSLFFFFAKGLERLCNVNPRLFFRLRRFQLRRFLKNRFQRIKKGLKV